MPYILHCIMAQVPKERPMNPNNLLIEQMRAATRSLMRHAPPAAQSMVEESMKTVASLQNTGQAVAESQQAAQETGAAAQQAGFDPFSDMLADFGRLGQAYGNPFGMPSPSPDAGTTSLPGRFIDGSYTNDAGARDYKLYVPSTYKDGGPRHAAPLLMMLHGCSQSAEDFALGTGMNALAEEYGCLVVYPAQAQQANAQRCWNWFNAVDQQRGQGEPSILAGMTEDIMTRYAIDPERVYVAGLSAGGAMAAILGTQYPELYAAVGVHSGLPFGAAHDLSSAIAAMQGEFQRQAPGRGVPVIVFHGDRDTTVHPANGAEVIRHRRRHASDQEAVEAGHVPDGHAYTRTVHRQPDGTIGAEHWVVHDAGHAWSGGDTRGTYTDGKGPNASREMMRFFQTRH
jgi:poly(hydroxyalkanoate) depolymerase family esterase